MLKVIDELKIKIFADGADEAGMLEMYANPLIKGLTTNPRLMQEAGNSDYRSFCKRVLETIKSKPISFEVLSDDMIEMERQALEIASWGENVYVKIPVMNTTRDPCYDLVKKLTTQNVKVNVTAIMTIDQINNVVSSLNPKVPSYVSVFAGRIADTGCNPSPIMADALKMMENNPESELIWASPREVLNIFQADEVGCHVITVTNQLIRKLDKIGYDLSEYSLDTVKMFHDSAVHAGYVL